MQNINRVQLKNAPYNPRVIDEKSRKKLLKVIQKTGLVEPLVWNKQTGNIVGGHQRIKILDSLEGTGDYSLDVAVVDLSMKEEIEANIALNNQESQGSFELDKLAGLFKEHNLDHEATGFDMADMFQYFGEDPAFIKSNEELEKMAEDLRKLKESSVFVEDATTNIESTDYYAVLVFRDGTSRKRWCDKIGIVDDRYVDGKFVAEMMKIDLDTPSEQEEKEREEAIKKNEEK
jgi:hypothetical protein